MSLQKNHPPQTTTMCDCIGLVNEELSKRNTALTTTIVLREGTLAVLGVQIATHKKDTGKRGKPVSLTAAYCPFCGVKYTDL